VSQEEWRALPYPAHHLPLLLHPWVQITGPWDPLGELHGAGELQSTGGAEEGWAS